MNNESVFDALDTRMVFRVYAVAAWIAGGGGSSSEKHAASILTGNAP